jgi:hypothetical protein
MAASNEILFSVGGTRARHHADPHRGGPSNLQASCASGFFDLIEMGGRQTPYKAAPAVMSA